MPAAMSLELREEMASDPPALSRLSAIAAGDEVSATVFLPAPGRPMTSTTSPSRWVRPPAPAFLPAAGPPCRPTARRPGAIVIVDDDAARADDDTVSMRVAPATGTMTAERPISHARRSRRAGAVPGGDACKDRVRRAVAPVGRRRRAVGEQRDVVGEAVRPRRSDVVVLPDVEFHLDSRDLGDAPGFLDLADVTLQRPIDSTNHRVSTRRARAPPSRRRTRVRSMKLIEWIVRRRARGGSLDTRPPGAARGRQLPMPCGRVAALGCDPNARSIPPQLATARPISRSLCPTSPSSRSTHRRCREALCRHRTRRGALPLPGRRPAHAP